MKKILFLVCLFAFFIVNGSVPGILGIVLSVILAIATVGIIIWGIVDIFIQGGSPGTGNFFASLFLMLLPFIGLAIILALCFKFLY